MQTWQFSFLCVVNICILTQPSAQSLTFLSLVVQVSFSLSCSGVQTEVTPSQIQWGMQTGQVSSLPVSPFGHADVSIQEPSNWGKGNDVCVLSALHVHRFPWQPEAMPVSEQPASLCEVRWCVADSLKPPIIPFITQTPPPKKNNKTQKTKNTINAYTDTHKKEK